MSWASYALTALAVLLAVGTFAWQTPYIGLVGSLGGHLPGWLIAIAAAGTATGAIAWLQDPTASVAIAVALCVLATAFGVKIVVDQRAALRAVGIRARPADFFGPLLRSAPGPDDVVTYGPVDGHSPRMAVYRPVPSDTPAPVVVQVHGGSWSSGSEVSDTRFCRYLTDHGYLVFSPTYTLASEGTPTWDLAPRQIARALATAAGLRDRYGGATDRLYVTGGSAGGQLAALVANRVSGGHTFGEEDVAMPAITAVAVHIAAIDPGLSAGSPFAVAGPLSRRIAETYTGGTPEAVPERYEAANATNFLDGSSPPTLLVYGPNDWLVPCQASLTFAQRARTEGVEVQTFAVPWTGHLIGLSGAGGRAIAELTTRWFDAHA